MTSMIRSNSGAPRDAYRRPRNVLENFDGISKTSVTYDEGRRGGGVQAGWIGRSAAAGSTAGAFLCNLLQSNGNADPFAPS